MAITLETARLRLRSWREQDRRPFRALMEDPEVMADLGGPLGQDAADAKLDRYVAAEARHGCARLALETLDGRFLGYVGLTRQAGMHPLSGRHEIGWRLARSAWGQGYAAEAAAAALTDGFERLRLDEILAFTAAGNHRSQAVMRKLGMIRTPALDFTVDDLPMPPWPALVWTSRPGRD